MNEPQKVGTPTPQLKVAPETLIQGYYTATGNLLLISMMYSNMYSAKLSVFGEIGPLEN